MAKKAPVGEEPYRPISENLIRSVLTPQPPSAQQPVPAPSHSLLPERVEETARVVHLQTRAPEPAPHELRSAASPRRPRLAANPREEDVMQPRKLDREKRMLLTQDEERSVDRFVSELGSELGAAVKLSHVLRACVLLVRNAEDHILGRARSAPRLSRPPNGDVPALVEFEREVARVLSAAFRDAPALK